MLGKIRVKLKGKLNHFKQVDIGKIFPKWQVCSHFQGERICWSNFSKMSPKGNRALPKGSGSPENLQILHFTLGPLFALNKK